MSGQLKLIASIMILCLVIAPTSFIALMFSTHDETDRMCGTEQVGITVLMTLAILSLLGLTTTMVLLLLNAIWRWW